MSIEGLIKVLSGIAEEYPGIEVCAENEGMTCDVETVQVSRSKSRDCLVVILNQTAGNIDQ